MVLDQLLATAMQNQGTSARDQLLARIRGMGGMPYLDRLPSCGLTKYVIEYLLFCRLQNSSQRTLRSYAQFLGYFLDFLIGQRLPTEPARIEQNDILFFVLEQQERTTRYGRKAAPETVSVLYRTVHTFFNWMERQGHVSRNPFDKLKAPRVPKKMVKAWPDDIVARILTYSQADRTFLGMRNYAMILIFLDTGVRQIEMAAMQVQDVYFDQCLIKVFGKGAKERIVPFGESAQGTLLRYLLQRKDESEALWVTEDGTPMSLDAVNIAMRRISLRAGVPATMKRGPHSYRHTAATIYLRNGGNLKCLQELYGHVDIRTTQKYLDMLGPKAVIEDHAKASPVDRLLMRPGDQLPSKGKYPRLSGRRLQRPS